LAVNEKGEVIGEIKTVTVEKVVEVRDQEKIEELEKRLA